MHLISLASTKGEPSPNSVVGAIRNTRHLSSITSYQVAVSNGEVAYINVLSDCFLEEEMRGEVCHKILFSEKYIENNYIMNP